MDYMIYSKVAETTSKTIIPRLAKIEIFFTLLMFFASEHEVSSVVTESASIISLIFFFVEKRK